MVDHPLVPDDIKSYMARHNLEAVLNKGLNVVLKQMPQDPLSLLAATLIDASPCYPLFEKFQARETIVAADVSPTIVKTLKVTVFLNYQGKVQPFYTYVQPMNLESDGGCGPITDFKEACRVINEDLSQLLKGKDVLALKKIDDILLNYQKKQAEGGEVAIHDNVIRACSEALLYSYSQAVNPASPYQGLYRYLKNRDLAPGSGSFPKLMFNVLNGGKALASKVKFSRFYLILDVSPEDADVDALEIFLKVQTQLKKQVQTHKLGENGFKGGAPDGSYFNALENNNESYKFIEDAIAACQVNTDKKKYLKFGVNPDIENVFLRDQNKYDIEGPKNLFDTDQLIEWLVKQCNEHPLLEYLEDPLVDGDPAAYQRLLKRFKEAAPRVKVGVKGWFKSSFEHVKQYTQIISKDEDSEGEDEPGQSTPRAEAAAAEDAPKQQPPSLEELNKSKFIPHVIHLERSLIPKNSAFKLWELILYQQSLKPEEQFEVIVEDCYYESIAGGVELIDFAVGASVGWVNLRGFMRPERTQKVARLQEIIEEVRSAATNSQ